MRIVDSTNIGSAAAPQTGRAGGLQSIDSAGKNGSALRKGASGADSVELSSFADRLSQSMQAASASRVERVAQLTAAVQSGSYKVDSQALSHSMVSQAISSGTGGKL
jgi:flagellar biosynthesis anti-sigma factor FlgM